MNKPLENARLFAYTHQAIVNEDWKKKTEKEHEASLWVNS